ncbi:MAG: HAMP domain-containing histidine kinase [Bacteroidetes bacterium]|nr:HAMP domain-containing histidine kinase [Bacteroidota bacterium]
MRQKGFLWINTGMVFTLASFSFLTYSWLKFEYNRYTAYVESVFRQTQNEEMDKILKSSINKQNALHLNQNTVDTNQLSLVVTPNASKDSLTFNGLLQYPKDSALLESLPAKTKKAIDSVTRFYRVDSPSYARHIANVSNALRDLGIDNSYTVFNKSTCESCTEAYNLLKLEQREKVLAYSATFTISDFELLKGIIPQILVSLFVLFTIIFIFILLKRNIKEKNKSLQLKESFVSNMTHELKTPIATISVALNSIKKGLGNKILTEDYIDISTQELERLELLIDSVLKMSKFENDELEFRMEKVDLGSLMHDVIHKMRPMLDDRKATVSFDDSVKCKYWILADHTHLTNVIYNIVDNSIKYSLGRLQIDYKISLNNEYAILTYRDNGSGIPERHLSKVFERFYRVPNKGIQATKGNGLGLSYVKEVIERLGGEISLSSTEGIGTIFTIKLKRFFDAE